MFSLRDLRFVFCSRDLDVLRAQRIIGFFILITHKSTMSGNLLWFWSSVTLSLWFTVKLLFCFQRRPEKQCLLVWVSSASHSKRECDTYTLYFNSPLCHLTGALFTGIYGLWNVYVFAVIFLYAPSSSPPANGKIRMKMYADTCTRTPHARTHECTQTYAPFVL